jgi:hypothetical protein
MPTKTSTKEKLYPQMHYLPRDHNSSDHKHQPRHTLAAASAAHRTKHQCTAGSLRIISRSFDRKDSWKMLALAACSCIARP